MLVLIKRPHPFTTLNTLKTRKNERENENRTSGFEEALREPSGLLLPHLHVTLITPFIYSVPAMFRCFFGGLTSCAWTSLDLGSVSPSSLIQINCSLVYAPKRVAPRDAFMTVFLFVCHLFCLSAMHVPYHPVLHGFEGSAWARNLGVPLSDLRLLCGSIDGRGGESRNVHPIV